MQPIFCVGLTGGIGSGKSAVLQHFNSCGAYTLDTDDVAHQLTAAQGGAMTKIAQLFGQSVVASDGSLNRSAMRELAFSDHTARQQLEAILHPMIGSIVRDSLRTAKTYAVIAVPLLFERGGLLPLCHRTLTVDCQEAVQIARVMVRSQLTEVAVKSIIQQQMPRFERARRANCVIENNGTIGEIHQRVERLHAHFVSTVLALNTTTR